MQYRRIYWLLIVLLLLAFLPGRVVNSQAPESCPQIVQLALDTTDQVCSGIGDNQACYGHVMVDAVARPGADAFSFDSEGDVARLFDVQTLRLSPMDIGRGTWGVALINMQAYLRYAMPENITFLLFGDVEIEDTREPLTSLQVVVHAREYVNARIAPDENSGVLETLVPGQTLTAQGRTADGVWVRVVLPTSRRVGWMHHSVLNTDGDLGTLRVVADESDYYGPMQAFYFRSGTADAYCPESPESGLLVQTPEGVAEVTLLINEVSIAMQATAFLQAQPGGEMTVGVIEGWAEVEVNGQRQPVFAGTEVSIPMSENRQPSGPPSEPSPYEFARLQALPLTMLSKPAVLAAPLPEAQLAQHMHQWRHQGRAVVQQGAPAGQEVLYYTDNGMPVVMGDDGAPVVVNSSNPAAPGSGALPGADDPLSSGGDNPPPAGGDDPPPAGGDDPPPAAPDPTPDPGSGPPGLGGVLPPGQGGDNPGQGGGVPPGQAKKD